MKGKHGTAKEQLPEINEEDAFHLIVRARREGWRTGYSDYGHDLYLPNVVRYYVTTVCGLDDPAGGPKEQQISPPFLAAAWELARRGILRPGVKAFRQQSTDDGSAGAGFSVTPAGRQWLQEAIPVSDVSIDVGIGVVSDPNLDFRPYPPNGQSFDVDALLWRNPQ